VAGQEKSCHGHAFELREQERGEFMENQSRPADAEEKENWWDYCPVCSSKLINQKCKYTCPNPKCNFFMSCSEFDL
jgi:hypothetical protein